MNVVYLVQHGKAKDKEEDPKRPLNEDGRRETKRMAALTSQLDLEMDEIRHSGKTRAEETAVIFARALDMTDKVRQVEGMAPTDDVEAFASRLEKESGPVMLVGHKPFMPRLAGYLVNGDPEESPVSFLHSGVVAIVHNDTGWQLTPI